MGQESFDLYVLGFLIGMVQTDKNHTDLILQTAKDQSDIYQNDDTYFDQLLQAADSIFLSGDHIEYRFLKSLYEMRLKLDDEMNPKSRFKKMFNGSLYAKSHIKPESRVKQSLENIKILSQKYEEQVMFGIFKKELTSDKANILAFKLAKYYMNSFFDGTGVATNERLMDQIDAYLKEEKITSTKEQKEWILKKALYEAATINE